jgi:hypothetical protein
MHCWPSKPHSRTDAKPHTGTLLLLCRAGCCLALEDAHHSHCCCPAAGERLKAGAQPNLKWQKSAPAVACMHSQCITTIGAHCIAENKMARPHLHYVHNKPGNVTLYTCTLKVIKPARLTLRCSDAAHLLCTYCTCMVHDMHIALTFVCSACTCPQSKAVLSAWYPRTTQTPAA